MMSLPQQVFKKWVHSFEEDAGGYKVFRPAEFSFPPARGRAGMEFSADGRFIDWAIGRGDAPQSIKGQWRLEAPNRLSILFPGGTRAPRHLELAEFNDSILKVRET